MGEVTPHPRAGAITAPARLSQAHDLGGFDCGRPPLNDWLRLHAFKSEGRTARTYVVCNGASVVGYYCIATGSVERQLAPSKLKRNAPDEVPIAIIGRLAVDSRWHRKGLGADLLKDAFLRILRASEIIGVSAGIVHAIDDEARDFYMRQANFIEYPADSRTLFLPLKNLAAAL